jgi:hypothetical protein
MTPARLVQNIGSCFRLPPGHSKEQNIQDPCQALLGKDCTASWGAVVILL